MESLRFFTARIISCYLEIDCWEEEWEEVKAVLVPPENVLNDFLDDITKFNDVDSINIAETNSYHITWGSIFKHYVSKPKKFGIDRITRALKGLFIDCRVNEDNAGDLFNISVVLCDSNDDEVKFKAIENVVMIIENRWFNWSNKRDLYSYLEKMGVAPLWYVEYLQS